MKMYQCRDLTCLDQVNGCVLVEITLGHLLSDEGALSDVALTGTAPVQ
jgi:hypothetical protein